MSVQDWLPSLWRSDSGTPTINSLRQEIDKVFNDFARDFPMPTMFGSNEFLPAMDTHEDEKQVTLRVELPGVEQKDVDLSVTDQTLTISGEKKATTESKDNGNHRTESVYGSFSRSLVLPFKINADTVKARFDKGVLTVTIDKPADYQATPKKIPISA